MSEQTLYRCKKRDAGMEVGDARGLHQIEEKNRKFKQMLAEEKLDSRALKGVRGKL